VEGLGRVAALFGTEALAFFVEPRAMPFIIVRSGGRTLADVFLYRLLGNPLANLFFGGAGEDVVTIDGHHLVDHPWTLARSESLTLEVVELVHRVHRNLLPGDVFDAELAEELFALRGIGQRGLAAFEQVDDRVRREARGLGRFDRGLHSVRLR